MLYAGTVWLNRTEEEFWNMTPRKFYALLTVHYDLKRLENGESNDSNWRTHNPAGEVYIDQIPGL
jgi:hypothetical protein